MSSKNVRFLIVAAFALPLLWLSAAAAYVNVARSAPDNVIGGWPSNGFAYSAAADEVLRTETERNNNIMPSRLDPRIGTLARAAFRLEPMDERAVRQIALIQAQENGKPFARKTMVLASKIGRRDLIANMWLVEDYGRADNLPKVLEHLDFALRTSGESRSVLMAALVQAMASAEMVKQMRKLLANDPAWRYEFWSRVTEVKAPLENAVALRIAVAGDGVDVPVDADQQLLRNLVHTGNYPYAFRLYRVLDAVDKPGNVARQSVGFDSPAKWPPIDWQVSSEGAYSAWLNTDRKELEVSLLGQTDAVFAQRLVELAPGSYRLSGEISTSEPALAKALSLSLECAEAEGSKAWSTVLNFERAAAAKSVELTDGGCRYFWLNVRGAPAGRSVGYDAVFRSVTLVRSNG